MKISKLTPNAKNPRTISDEKLGMLKRALVKFGDLSGIVYNKKSAQLVCGHQRVKSIDDDPDITLTKKYSKPTKTGTTAEGYFESNGEKFQYREVWWDDATEKAANIAANKGAGSWDMPQLSEWLRELSEFDLDFDLDLTMFDTDERRELGSTTVAEHTRTGKTGVDEDEVPEKAPTRSRLGDLYLLGEHRLLCGDSTKETSVARLMKGQKADMVFTDPPYGMNLDTDYGSSMKYKLGNRSKKDYKPVQGDDREFDFESVFKLVSGVQEQFWFGADYFCNVLPKGGSWFVWNKKTTEALQKMFGSDFELCWSRQKHARECANVTWSGPFGHNKTDDGAKKVHPTMKPIKLIEWFFERIEGQLVVDLFGGSGSTLIACEKTHRKCYMMEIDPHYCDVIVERWEKYTGLKAKLVRAETKSMLSKDRNKDGNKSKVSQKLASV